MSNKTIQDFLKNPYLKDLIDISDRFHMHGRYLMLNTEEYKGVAFLSFHNPPEIQGMTDKELLNLSNALQGDGEYIPVRCRVFKFEGRDPFILHHNIVEYMRNVEFIRSCCLTAEVECPERMHIEKFAYIKKHFIDYSNYNLKADDRLQAIDTAKCLLRNNNETRWRARRYTSKHISKQTRAYKNSITLKKLKKNIQEKDIATIEIPANKAGMFKSKMRKNADICYAVSHPYTVPRLKETRMYEKSPVAVNSDPLVTVYFDKKYKTQVYKVASLIVFDVDAAIYNSSPDNEKENRYLVTVPSNKLEKFTDLCKEKGVDLSKYRGVYKYGFAPFSYSVKYQGAIKNILWGLLKEAEAFHLYTPPELVPNYKPELGVNNKPKDIVNRDGKTLSQLLAEENRTAIKPLNVTVIKGKVPYNDFSR